MRRRLPILALFAVTLVGVCSLFSSAQETSSGARKILNRVNPQYPAVARNMHIVGSVKLEAVVAANGTVKSVDVKGGHPLLAQAAQVAIREWKFEPASKETHENIEVKFNTE